MATVELNTHSVPEPHPLFQTYELLEHIFSLLDHVSLRQARLANNFWHSVISQNAILCRTWRQRLRLRDLKILLLGASNIGKGTLITKWCYSSADVRKVFDPKFSNSIIKLPETDGEVWMARMYAFEGDAFEFARFEGLRAFGGLLEHGVQAIVLVYEVGSRYSFEMCRKWAARVRSEQNTRGAMLIGLLATKCDLPPASREVSTPEGVGLANELGVPFWESSSRAEDPGIQKPLKGFFKSYKEVKMHEKAERQTRKDSAIEMERTLQHGETAIVDSRQSQKQSRLKEPSTQTAAEERAGLTQAMMEALISLFARVCR